MSEELKPCPFCGGHDLDCAFYERDDHTERRTEMQCRSCGATGPIETVYDSYMGSEYPSVTAEAWNRRAIPIDAIKEAAKEIVYNSFVQFAREDKK